MTTLTEHIGVLRDALLHVKSSQPFHIDAMVALLDHFHLLMTLPPDDANSSYRTDATNRRFWEHLIRDDRDFAIHVDYIHINPVKHGVAQRASDWPHSTVHLLSSTVWLRRTMGLTLAMASLGRFDVGLDETQPNRLRAAY